MTIFEKIRFVHRDFLLLDRSFLVICRTNLVLFLPSIAFSQRISGKI